MGRNVNSFFSENPASVDVSRSRFQRNQNIKTSFNAGDLIPFYLDEVLPGDTVSIDTSKVVRMSTLIAPIMDNIYLDTYFFFVPNRLVWDHWKQFMGENTESAWIPETSYTVPQVTAPQDGWNVGTIADYMGIPTGVGGLSVDAMPFRAYALICNEWFRDENLTDPIYIDTGDSTLAGSNGSSFRTDVPKGGAPFKAAKYHDYFTSALPAPQKGPDVPLPLGQQAIVYASDTDSSSLSNHAIWYKTVDGSVFPQGLHDMALRGASGGSSIGTQSVDLATRSASFTSEKGIFPINLIADLTTATGTSINQLRQAFQVQKLYEKDARGGTRYTEILKSHFGVTSPDSRLQRPEYLGGSRVPINVHQVIQNSATDSVSPQGNTAAYSLTIDSHSDFTKSFTEHGWIMGLCVARYDHTYQQGLERMWSRKVREDYYFPVFANLGEQAIKNKEIYAQGTSADDEVFGYSEAWAEYRFKPSRISGELRSQYSASLDLWHLGDDYASLPQLSDAWIREDKSNIDRTLAVTSAVSHQFIADIFVKNSEVRIMPLYSIPGLIDHH